MRQVARYSSFLLFCFLALRVSAEPLRLQDDLGRWVTFSQPAQSLVSLSPAMTELLFAIGAGHQVMGTSSGTLYPEKAKFLPIVASPGQVNIEAIIALKPDLVLFWSDGFSVAKAAKLEKFGIRWFAIAPKTLEDLATLIETLGRLTGHREAARAQAAHFRSQIAEIKATNQNKPPVSYFYQISARPLLTLNGAHMVSEALRLCGGKNVFSKLPTLVPRVGLEAVLAADPEVIFISEGIRRQVGDYWEKWAFLRAVDKQQILMLSDDEIQRPTLRLLDGIKTACLALNRVRSIDKPG